MKRIATSFILVFVLWPGAVQAQAIKPRPEVGFRGGLSVFREGGESFSVLSFPGSQGPFTVGTAYVMMFVRPQLALEPQVGLVRFGTASSSTGAFTGALQLNQFTGDASAGSAFGFLNGGFTSGFGGGGGTSFAAGAGAGYRTIVSETLGARVEARYRRLFSDQSDGVNEFSLLIGLGAVLGNSSR